MAGELDRYYAFGRALGKWFTLDRDLLNQGVKEWLLRVFHNIERWHASSYKGKKHKRQ